MLGVTMLKHTNPMTEISFFRAREPAGMKRTARRAFWRAFRHELPIVVAEQLDGNEDIQELDNNLLRNEGCDCDWEWVNMQLQCKVYSF